MVTVQHFLQNPALRWSSSFIIVTGVFASLILAALNSPSTAQSMLSPLASAVMIELPPLLKTPDIALKSTPEQEPTQEQIPLESDKKPLIELPRIKTAEALLPAKKKPKTKKTTPPVEKKPVLKESRPENITTPVQQLTPTPSPTGSPSSTTDNQATATWQSDLVAHIHRYKRYPKQARRRGQEAVIYVQVTINRDGQVIKHQLEKASRYKALNREVINLMTRAQPLPTPPKEVKGETLEILLPVVFSLNR